MPPYNNRCLSFSVRSITKRVASMSALAKKLKDGASLIQKDNVSFGSRALFFTLRAIKKLTAQFEEYFISTGRIYQITHS